MMAPRTLVMTGGPRKHGGVRDGDRARGQRGLGQYQADRFIDRTVRIVERQLNTQGGVDAGGEHQFATNGHGRNMAECFEFIHDQNYTHAGAQAQRHVAPLWCRFGAESRIEAGMRQ